MKLLQIILIFTCHFWTIILCFKNGCQTVFDYQDRIITWENQSFWHWLDALNDLKFKDIANAEMSSFENLTNNQLPLLRGPYLCNGQQTAVRFDGNFKVDKDGQVTGKGKIFHIVSDVSNQMHQNLNS